MPLPRIIVCHLFASVGDRAWTRPAWTRRGAGRFQVKKKVEVRLNDGPDGFRGLTACVVTCRVVDLDELASEYTCSSPRLTKPIRYFDHAGITMPHLGPVAGLARAVERDVLREASGRGRGKLDSKTRRATKTHFVSRGGIEPMPSEPE